MPDIVDLFCGIGGVAEATRDDLDTPTGPDARAGSDGDAFRVVAALDVDRRVGPIYAVNHGVEPRHRTLESIDEIPAADLWWLSPPCQPYTSRGRRLQEDDPRSAALQHLIDRLDRQRPRWMILENVPPFAGSAHHRRLTAVLRQAGYVVAEDVLCPTAWGVPMRRPRFYLRAARDGERLAEVTPVKDPRPITQFLDESAWEDATLRLDERQFRRFAPAMRLVDADRSAAVASCFTSAYGRSPVRAGSYLCRGAESGIRRFSPREIARLMGFRDDFWWPKQLDSRARYRLLGNALSVTVVRALLRSLGEAGFRSRVPPGRTDAT